MKALFEIEAGIFSGVSAIILLFEKCGIFVGFVGDFAVPKSPILCSLTFDSCSVFGITSSEGRNMSGPGCAV